MAEGGRKVLLLVEKATVPIQMEAQAGITEVDPFVRIALCSKHACTLRSANKAALTREGSLHSSSGASVGHVRASIQAESFMFRCKSMWFAANAVGSNCAIQSVACGCHQLVFSYLIPNIKATALDIELWNVSRKEQQAALCPWTL